MITHGSVDVKLGMHYFVFLACCLGAVIHGPGADSYTTDHTNTQIYINNILDLSAPGIVHIAE
jgi:hypothetical protein